MKDKLSYAEMVALVDNILDPKDYTSEEINLQLIQFCARARSARSNENRFGNDAAYDRLSACR